MNPNSICLWIYKSFLYLRTQPVRRESFLKRTLIFSPHPDDETLGCGGIIQLKKNFQSDVKIVFVTDGSQSHQNHFPTAVLSEIRQLEAIRACEKLGIPKENLIFLQFPDACLQHHQRKLEKAVTKIILTYSPEEIFIPHRLEDNSDHFITHKVVNHVVRKINQPVALYEYLVWSWVQWPNISIRNINNSRQKTIKKIIRSAGGLRILLATNRRVNVDVLLPNKKRALEEYTSQTQPALSNSNYNTLENLHGGEFLKACFQNWEFFRYSSAK